MITFWLGIVAGYLLAGAAVTGAVQVACKRSRKLGFEGWLAGILGWPILILAVAVAVLLMVMLP